MLPERMMRATSWPFALSSSSLRELLTKNSSLDSRLESAAMRTVPIPRAGDERQKHQPSKHTQTAAKPRRLRDPTSMMIFRRVATQLDIAPPIGRLASHVYQIQAARREPSHRAAAPSLAECYSSDVGRLNCFPFPLSKNAAPPDSVPCDEEIRCRALHKSAPDDSPRHCEEKIR